MVETVLQATMITIYNLGSSPGGFDRWMHGRSTGAYLEQHATYEAKRRLRRDQFQMKNLTIYIAPQPRHKIIP